MKVGDTIKNYGTITKLSESIVWFGEKRYSVKTVEKNSTGIIYLDSPDANINWTDEKAVDDYYTSFQRWSGVIRMGDSRTSQLLEVKNNKILFEGEYYLPYYSHHINLPEKKFLKDCRIFGYCLKMHNAFYKFQNPSTVNVFYIEYEISDELYNYSIKKEEDFKNLSAIDYIKTLDLTKINGKDLNLLKENFISLFDKSIFPYYTNNVYFGIGNFDRIEISHRSRSGYLEMNNGYRGQQPFKNDYYAILKACPYFTNVSNAYTQLEQNELTFNKKMLDALSLKIVKAWDHAIEQNYGIYG